MCHPAPLAPLRKPSCAWRPADLGGREGRASALSSVTLFVKMLSKLAAEMAVSRRIRHHQERARLSTNDCVQWSSRKRFRNLCFIKFIEFAQHYKQLITVIFPTDDSIPQYHLLTEHLLAMASANHPPPWCQKQ